MREHRIASEIGSAGASPYRFIRYYDGAIETAAPVRAESNSASIVLALRR